MITATAYHAGRFLKESELLDDSKYCPWCGYGGVRPHVVNLQQNPDVWLLACPRCHAISSSHVATQAALEAYYGSYYADDCKNRITYVDPKRIARHILRYVKLKAKPASLRILDFGGGDGSNSHAAALELIKRGAAAVDIIVTDLDHSLTTPAHPAVRLSHTSTLEEIPDSQTFHLVIASSVLEHLARPAETTRSLLSRLEPGGYFYARTSFVVPVLRLLRALRLSVDFTFPAHFHDLGQDFWENILSTLELLADEWTLARSRPSPVETGFRQNPARTLAAYCLKAPWWLLGRRYGLTGGWEAVFVRRERL